MRYHIKPNDILSLDFYVEHFLHLNQYDLDLILEKELNDFNQMIVKRVRVRQILTPIDVVFLSEETRFMFPVITGACASIVLSLIENFENRMECLALDSIPVGTYCKLVKNDFVNMQPISKKKDAMYYNILHRLRPFKTYRFHNNSLLLTTYIEKLKAAIKATTWMEEETHADLSVKEMVKYICHYFMGLPNTRMREIDTIEVPYMLEEALRENLSWYNCLRMHPDYEDILTKSFTYYTKSMPYVQTEVTIFDLLDYIKKKEESDKLEKMIARGCTATYYWESADSVERNAIYGSNGFYF